MRKEDFNIYEFHQRLCREVSPAQPDSALLRMREEIESKLATDLTHREEVECKQQLREIQDKLTLDVTTEIFFHQAKPLVEEFRSALNSTVRDSFVKKPRAAPSSARKMELIDEYILRLQSYPELASFLPLFSYHRNSDQCEDCGAELVDVDADSLLCDQCGREYPFYLQEGHREPTFKDLGRINTNVKYSYIRQTHFRDTIKQFQGKQNKYIDPVVYDRLVGSIEANQLNKKGKTGKYSQISKDHIKMFLQEHSLYKYYEDINLIYSELTGCPCPDISEYEKALFEDFERLILVYDKVIKENPKYNRSNFLNSYYILFQLLKRHAYPCKESDFPIIKTIERKIEHDEIYEECCRQLGWFFYPTV
jgi:hypothetical protein